jgi:hypothetical protein
MGIDAQASSNTRRGRLLGDVDHEHPDGTCLQDVVADGAEQVRAELTVPTRSHDSDRPPEVRDEPSKATSSLRGT